MPAAGTAAAPPPPPRNTHRRAPARRRIRINQHGRKQKRSKRETYHRVLVYFMRYRDQIEYKFGHQFTQEQLMSITPTDLIKYFKYHCYGNPDADTDIECPQHRSAKVPLVCDGVDAELLMEPLECTKTIFCQSRFCLATMQPIEGNGDHRVHHAMHRQETRMLTAQVLQLRREVADSKGEEERRHNIQQALLHLLERKLNRLMRIPANRHAAAGEELTEALGEEAPRGVTNTNNPIPLVAKVSRCPRTLHALWKEWEEGSAGQKAVRLWTASERGKHKHTIYKRKFLWDKVSEMVNAGIHCDLACDMIYNAYGQNLPVTKILTKLQADAKTGDHPNLRTLHR